MRSAALALASAVPAPWRGVLADAIAAPSFAELAVFLEAERTRSTTVYPPADLVFNALALTPLEAVRAVVIGQDPYTRPGQAHGLAFSVPKGQRPPGSLRHILTELGEPHAGPSLEPWARRGVLLLNTVMTIAADPPRSHRGRGWEEFTDAVIRAVIERPGPVVFLLWGKVAQEKLELIDRQRHLVFTAAHPSWRSVSGFRGKAGFAQANTELYARGLTPINWSLESPGGT